MSYLTDEQYEKLVAGAGAEAAEEIRDLTDEFIGGLEVTVSKAFARQPRLKLNEIRFELLLDGRHNMNITMDAE